MALQLSGGDDALNTARPCRNDEGEAPVINGVGYPSPKRSHFRAMYIRHTAESEGIGKSS